MTGGRWLVIGDIYGLTVKGGGFSLTGGLQTQWPWFPHRRTFSGTTVTVRGSTLPFICRFQSSWRESVFPNTWQKAIAFTSADRETAARWAMAPWVTEWLSAHLSLSVCPDCPLLLGWLQAWGGEHQERKTGPGRNKAKCSVPWFPNLVQYLNHPSSMLKIQISGQTGFSLEKFWFSESGLRWGPEFCILTNSTGGHDAQSTLVLKGQ